MKKLIFSFLGLSIIVFCCSTNMQAQSSEQDLDQVELMKQFIGKWVAETGEDSTVVWEVIPLNKGYEQIITWKAKEETLETDKGMIGFTPDGDIGLVILWSGNANLSTDIGQFVSEDKATFDRYNLNRTHAQTILNFSFISPDKLSMEWKWRGTKKTWDEAIPAEWIWTRVKE